MSAPKLPKPEQFKLSPETQRAIAEFVRSVNVAGQQIAAAYAKACREINASAEQMRKARNQ